MYLLIRLVLNRVENAAAKVQVNQNRLTLNGTHQLPVYANHVNLLDEHKHYMQQHTFH
jgi:hypothetical protein